MISSNISGVLRYASRYWAVLILNLWTKPPHKSPFFPLRNLNFPPFTDLIIEHGFC